MTEPTPWPAMLAAACNLGVTPAAFWRLSLCEWRAMTAPLARTAALPRIDFEALARRFPD